MKKNEISQNDEEFVADSKAALLNKTTHYASAILITIACLIVVFLIWAYFAVIDTVTVAQAKVIPSSEVKVIQSLDGGIIKKILVKEGQTVNADQSLIILDDTRYKSDYQEQIAKYFSLLAENARLTAETKNESAILFPAILVKEAPELVDNQKNLFFTRKEALEKQLVNLEKSYKYTIEQVHILEPLVAKGIAPKIDLVRARQQVNEYQGKLQQTKEDFYKDTWKELNENQGQLKSTQESLVALKDKIQHTTLISPVKGIVKKVNVVTIGGVISPGIAIMEIVPIEDTLLVQAYVHPRDIAFIHPGQNATVKILAYDYSIYGDLKGMVETVSADAIEEKQDNTQDLKPQMYFLVNVRTDKNYLGTEKHKLPIIPGMTATVHIVTGEKTIMQYILKPLIKAKQEALREK